MVPGENRGAAEGSGNRAMNPASPSVHQWPVAPEHIQIMINFLVLCVLAGVLLFQYLTYTDIISLRETIRVMQLNARTN